MAAVPWTSKPRTCRCPAPTSGEGGPTAGVLLVTPRQPRSQLTRGADQAHPTQSSLDTNQRHQVTHSQLA